MKRIGWFVLSFLAVQIPALVTLAGTPLTVKVTIERVQPISCDEGDFVPCPDDYFARVNIANQGFQESDHIDNVGDIRPGWTFSRTVDSDAVNVPVVIEVWDHEDSSRNDQLGVSAHGKDIDLTLDLASGNWAGDVPSNVAESAGGNARVFFKLEVLGRADVDGDGIPDLVELTGLRNGAGTLVADLPAMGADPCRKTIAVEIDFMEQAGLGHTHRPQAAAIAEVVAAFDAAPVPAITGAACPYAGFPRRATGIDFIADVDDPLPHQAALEWGTGGEALRDANFDPIRRPYFHYSLWVHDRAAGNSSSGLCCSNSGKDALVSLGSWQGQVGSVRDQSGTLIHELGHALGLPHGGADGINCKPNYLSVMSYALQVTGIPDPTSSAPNVDLNGDGVLESRLRLDLSRASLPTLIESALLEANGIGDGTDLATWSHDAGVTRRTSAGNAPIDWNVSGAIDPATVSVDINNLGIDGCGLDSAGNAAPSPGETLIGFDDWTNIKYRAAFAPTAGAAPAVSGDAELDFPSAEKLKKGLLLAMQPDPSLSITASAASVTTGSNVTYTILVKNDRPMPATNVLVVDDLPAAMTFVSCTASGGGVCGGSGNRRTVLLPTLPGNGNAVITIVGTVGCAVPHGTVLANGAALTSETPDFDPGNNASSVTIKANNPPPRIANASVTPRLLWPANHKLVDVSVGYDVTDNCGVPGVALSIRSNEQQDGRGDGSTASDWSVLDAHRVRLRAERAGAGGGRVYTIQIAASDSGGGVSTHDLTVTVPHSSPR